MVNYKEGQAALRLIRDNFPRSLLWEWNTPHMKQKKQVYIQNVTTKSLVRKSVRFSLQSSRVCLGQMKILEDQYIKRHRNFHSFPQFLKRQNIFRTQFVKTKCTDGQENVVSIYHALRSCPVISGREVCLLDKWVNKQYTQWCHTAQVVGHSVLWRRFARRHKSWATQRYFSRQQSESSRTELVICNYVYLGRKISVLRSFQTPQVNIPWII